VNIFADGLQLSSKNPDSFYDPKAIKPLFTLELLKAINEDNFCYSSMIKNFTNTILMIFNKALEDLAKIPDLEPKLMKEIFKGTRSEMYYKVPQKS
jgi:dynein heavy chain